MNAVFADTVYWIALTNLHDQHHSAARQASANHGRGRIVTSEAVLTEYLNALAEKGFSVRTAAIRCVEAILNDPLVTMLPL